MGDTVLNFLNYKGLDYYDEKNKTWTEEKIAVETERATNVEDELNTKIVDEVTRAKSAEQTNADAINAETTRAQNAEITKVDKTTTINGKALSSNITLSASDVGADASGSASDALAEAKEYANDVYTNSNLYTDEKIADLINGAPTTLDTLKEIADAMAENEIVVEALDEAIGTKANQTELDSHTGNTTIHITATERTNWNDANSQKHTHSNKTVLDNTTASYTTALNTKLSGIATGAEVNQNAFSNVKVGTTTVSADTKTDTLELVAGTNVTITPDATNDKITISSTVPTKTSQLTNDSGFKTTDNNTTYSLSKSGSTITLTGSDGSTTSVTDSNTTYTHPTTDGNKHVPANGTTNGGKYLKATSTAGTYEWGSLTKSDVTTALGYTPPTSDTNTVTTVTTTGSGNAITALSATNGAITATKGSTFLTAHPTVSTSTDTTSTATATHGGTVTMVDSITRDGNGHVTKINTKTVTLPNDNNTDTKVTQTVKTDNANYPLLLAPSGQTATATTTACFDSGVTLNPSTNTIAANVSGSSAKLSNTSAIGSATNPVYFNASGVPVKTTYTLGKSVPTDAVFTDTVTTVTTTGTGNAITSLSASNGAITATKGSTFLTSHPTISTSTDSTSTASPSAGGTFTAVDSVTRDSNGHVTKVNTKTITLPNTSVTVDSALSSTSTNPVQNKVINSALSGKASTAVATTSANGLMSSTDKTKLDGIDEGANNYTHPTTSGNKHIPSGGSSGQILRWSADGTAVWGADNNTTYSNFVKSGSDAKAGLVPAPSTTAGTTKYLREDGTWAVPPNTNTTYSQATSSALGLVKIGYTASGKNYPVELNSSGQMYVNVPWTDNNTTYSAATTSANGLMTSAMVTKLNGITDSADSVSFTASLTSGTKVGTITINGTSTDLYAPTNTDTHYTSHLYVGASGGNANATSATSNPYLLMVDNTTNRNSIQLKAGSNMAISAVNGVVTFTATNTTYSAATTSAAGLMSAADKTKLDSIATGANNYTYTLPTASSSTLGGVKTTSTVTSTSGLTACPIINGVPYYKDTNTTYSLSSFGISATATELNYCAGVTSNIQTQIDNLKTSSDTKVTNTVATTTQFYLTGTTSTSTNTGTQVFDTGIYSTTTAGQLSVGSLQARGTISPSAAVSYNLGSTTLPWANSYVKSYAVYGAASAPYGYFQASTLGTTSTTGIAKLIVGNGTATGTANNAYGMLYLYGTSSGYTSITPGNNTTSNIALTLPSASGTLATTANLSSYLPLSGGTVTGTLLCNSHPILANAVFWHTRNSSGSNIAALGMNSSNQLLVGSGASSLIIGSSSTTSTLRICGSSRIDLLPYGSTTAASSGVSVVTYSSGSGIALRPTLSGNAYLGDTSYRWIIVYSESSLNVSSDRRKKDDIQDLDDRYLQLWDELSPKSYYIKVDKEHHRHLGFIAQDVEEAMLKVGLTYEECGFLHKDWVEKEEYTGYEYSLSYDDLAVLTTAKSKKQQTEIDSLKTELAELKALIAEKLV